jgi:hypothetical protein
MSSFPLRTTIGNLPTIVSTLENVGNIINQDSSAQTLSNGINSFPITLSVGKYEINYSVIIYQTTTSIQQFKSVECCLTSTSGLVRDNSFNLVNYVMSVNTANSDFICCSKSFGIDITTAGSYNLIVRTVFGSGYTYYCNIFFQSIRLI